MKTEPQTGLKSSDTIVGKDEFLTKRRLAERLGVTKRTVERWLHDGLLPHLKVGTIVLFYWPDVVAHLRAKYTLGAGEGRGA
jgi:excisionase family DNA binding protein